MPFNPFSSQSTNPKPILPKSSIPHPNPHSPHLHPTTHTHRSTYLSNPASFNPWNPQTPSYHLYRSFRAFTHTENLARSQRGERPFCTPAGRDKAFAKLMRLSKGEEEIGWEIECVDDGDWEDVNWYQGFDASMERVAEWDLGRGREGEEELMMMVGSVSGKVEKKEGGHERKDSKEVYHVVQDEEGWRRVERMQIDGHDDVDMSPEHKEDVEDSQ
jgi:hypothetical protein